MLQILLVFLYMSGDNTKQGVFGPVANFAVHGCLEILCINAVLSEEVWCFWEVLGMPHVSSVHMLSSLSVVSWGGHIFSVFVQLHSACVDVILHGNCGLSAHAVHTCSHVISASGILDNKVRGLLDVKELSHNYDVSDSMW